jgi:hypothetical protein
MARAERQFWLENLDTSEVKQVSVADSDEIEERHFRSMDYNSVLRTDTIPIQFPRDGGRAFDRGGYYFILNAKDARGTKARIQLTVKRLNPFTDGYEDSFQGMLEFSPQGGFTQEVEFVSVKVVDSRKLAKFKERDEIDYNVFSLVSSDNVIVPDFTNPYTEATYKKIDIYLDLESEGAIRFGGFTIETAIEPSYIQEYDGETIINEIEDRISISDPGELTIYSTDLDSDSLIIDNIISANTFISLGNVIVLSGATTWRITVSYVYYSYNSDNIVQSTEKVILEIIEGSGSGTWTMDSSINNISVPDITVLSGGWLDFGLLIEAETLAGGNIDVFGVINNNVSKYTNISFVEQTLGWEDNQIRGMYPLELGSRLLQLTTSETDTSKLLDASILGRTNSEFQTYSIDGYLSREFATNGFQLRQLVNRALNVNFKDWFRSLSAISPIGLWYNKVRDIFVIEDIEEFYKPELFPVSLGEAKNLKTTDFKELYFNSIQSGYPKTDYEDFQGVNETNTETEHEISIETKSKYEARSRYYGDSIGQELARRKNVSKFASQDTKYDNKVYLTTLNTSDETKQGGLYQLSGFKGIEQYYNMLKTPRQNLRRQSPLLLSPLYKDISEIITFRNSVKDTNIRYADLGTLTVINEFDNIEQTGLRDRLIDPELDEFEGLYTEEIANEIVNDPHRIFHYTDIDGADKYGYIWDVKGNRIKGVATYSLIKCNPNRVP